MHKFTPLVAGTAILLAGCAPSHKSRTWEFVRSAPHAGPSEKTPAQAYAAKLHSGLRATGVEHKVVTFKFRYRSRILLNREGEETAVIYRDASTPRHPWWLMAERLSTPVWLPTRPVASQVAFYLSRPVTLVKAEEFPARKTQHEGKGCFFW